MVRRLLTATGLCILLVILVSADGQVSGKDKTGTKEVPMNTTMQHKDHVLLTADQLEWGPAPPGLPPGAQVAILEGDPGKPGLFTMRAKMPAGYRVPPHFHPADEHVTVIEGTLKMGMGEQFNEASMTDLPAGAFAMMAKGTRHFAYTKDGATIQIHGQGPWGITYVNPADDPRNEHSSK